MWRYVLVLSLLAVVAAERHKRLTTFGKAPEKTSQATGKGKECKTDKECFSQTVCKEDKEDGKKRCICEDGAFPVNGHCLHTRGLGKACSASNECIQGAECRMNPNSTHKFKVCMCEEDMVEENGHCSGCGTLNYQGWLLTSIGSLLLAGILH